MPSDLWEICREAKDTMQPQKTNQDIADETGVSINSVSQFLRGETRSASINTIAPICKALHISIDQYYDIMPPADSAALLELRQRIEQQHAEIEQQQAEIDHQREILAMHERSARTKNIIIYLLSAIVALALVALIIDLCNPNLGWVRTALHMQFLQL